MNKLSHIIKPADGHSVLLGHLAFSGGLTLFDNKTIKAGTIHTIQNTTKRTFTQVLYVQICPFYLMRFHLSDSCSYPTGYFSD